MPAPINRRGLLFVVVLGGLSLSPIVNADDENDGAALTVDGLVVNSKGQPVPSGQVTIWQFEDDPAPRWETAARETLDRHGRYAVSGLTAPVSLLIVVAADSYALVHKQIHIEQGGLQQTAITLSPPRSVTLHVHNASGQPLAGTKVRVLTLEDANGSNSLSSVGLRDLQLFQVPSDERGRLYLNGLPQDGLLEIDVLHRDYVPTRLIDVRITDQAEPFDVELHQGVPMTLQMTSDSADPPIDHVEIDVRHNLVSHPSTLVRTFLPVDKNGAAHVTLAPGKYRSLWLKHPVALITPWYSRNIVKGEFLEWEAVTPRWYEFAVHQKVEFHGRAIDRTTGKPITKAWISAKIPNHLPEGTVPSGEDAWMHAGWGQTDDDGAYSLHAAAGPVRVWFEGEGYFGDDPFLEFTLDPTQGTAAPPFELTRIRPVQGQVLDLDGRPAAGVVVRFRGWHLRHRQPVVTDEQGRFTLEFTSIPVDRDTNERVLRHPIVAFHPHKPWGAVQWVSFDNPSRTTDVTIPLSVQKNVDVIGMVPDDRSPWERGDVDPTRLAGLQENSLIGQPCPSLDGRQWLNTDAAAKTLADFRGKYLLLVFWTTWCGPCHADFPSVKLLQEFYGDRGLQVIGIHDNSVDPADIAAHVAKEGLTFPTVIDHADGRIVKEFNSHGIEGYPSYVIVGPDGRVLMEDRTQPSPSLRVFKLELVKQLLASSAQENSE